MSQPTIRFTNIDGFVRALKKVDRELPKQFRRRLYKIAKVVSTTARQRMNFKHPSGRAEKSVKPRATQKGASIEGGGERVPYYPWLDFGGSVGRGHRPGIGWSGSVKRLSPPGGRYIYPAIAKHRDDTVRELVDAVEDSARRAGFKVGF